MMLAAEAFALSFRSLAETKMYHAEVSVRERLLGEPRAIMVVPIGDFSKEKIENSSWKRR